MRHTIRLSLLVGTLCWIALPAYSQWYVGASAGQSRASLDEGERSGQLADLGFIDAATNFDKTDAMYRLYGGYRFHPNLALEAGYVDLGKQRFHSSVSPPGFLDTSIRSDGADLCAVGVWRFGERFELLARVGAFLARTRASYSSEGSVRLVDGQQEQSKRSTRAVYGIGATYDFSRQLGLRVEWARYDRLGNDLTGGEHHTDTISAGIQWRF